MRGSSCGRHTVGLNTLAGRYIDDFPGPFRNSLRISNTNAFNRAKCKGLAEISDRNLD